MSFIFRLLVEWLPTDDTALRSCRWQNVVNSRGCSESSNEAHCAPDGRWFGATPETVIAVDGQPADELVPKIRYVVENYKFRAYGDYGAWPGSNSNTFVQAGLASVPELRAVLPPTAIGKDFPYNGRWIGRTSSGTGVFVSLAGYIGLTVGWVEGFEVNFFGAVIGFDIRCPALELPVLGRLGIAAGL